MLNFNPLKSVPENLRQAYRDQVAHCIQARVRFFSLTIYALYLVMMGVTLITHSQNPFGHRARVLALLTLGTAAVLIYNRMMVKCIHTAKISAFLFISFILFLQYYGPIENAEAFTYSGFVLMLLFSTLSFPWFLRDSLIVVGLHYIAWACYCYVRDFSLITIPPTAFGADPIVNGTAFISLAAIMCLLIRIKDNARDIHNFVLLKEVEAKNEQMERELEFASKIQDSLVPRSLESQNADVFVTYKPMESIGGDYANFQLVDKNRLVFFIGDVTGHGVPAALMVNRLHTEFDRLAASGLRPGEILRDLNRFILRAFEGTSMYLTAFCGMVDFEANKIYYSNYGHPPQYIFRLKDENVTALEPLTSLLGLDLGDLDATFESHIDYHEGDFIVMFTDGILEHKNEAGEEYGSQRLKRFVQSQGDAAPEKLHAGLIQDLSRFSAQKFKDDVFIISIKCKASLAAEVKI